VNARRHDGVHELSVPADPALALTARMFAGAVAEHMDEVAPDDLKLALSELLAAAVDAGSERVVFRADLDRSEVLITGAGLDDGTADEGLEEHERFARTHREDLLTALFPGLRADGDTIVLPLGNA
jgi:anti-sigma regulatory factor (Ser/Thr protein kinase)